LDCGSEHWLSLKECQAENFKVVCDCSKIFKPKRIKNINIEYITKLKTENNTNIKPEISEHQQPQLDSNILDKGCDLLVQYGFTRKESENLLIESYKNSNINDVTLLVKQALELFGRNK
jgi:Holliday junction resolvasome RuvABC DNA-binding subunit